MPSRGVKLAICLFLVISTVAVYWQVKDHEFLKLDDKCYVTENFIIKSGLTSEGARWAFTTIHCSNWHPLTWLSHMLDCHLYGLNPGGHHFTNLLFHVANTLLLFLLFAKLTAAVWPSALVAALFAIHPLHVESVAWVAERKDVLSAFFFLTSIWAYSRYVAAPHWGKYLLVFFLFALGLMAKPMVVTLPFVLLLLDYWPLGRLAPPSPTSGKRGKKTTGPSASRWPGKQIMGLVREKIPLFGLAAVSCILTLAAQKEAMASLEITLFSRMANSLVAYAAYLGKTFWPLHLAVWYPHPGNTLNSWQVGGAVLLLGGVTYAVLKKAGNHPYLPVGWLWYLGTLVPVIGLVQVGEQAMADRYTYLPLIGIFIILAWGSADLTAVRPRRRLALALAWGMALPLLMCLTWVQTGYWRNTRLLFEHAARVSDNNYRVYSILIDHFGETGMIDEAVPMFQNTVRLKPGYAPAYTSMGNAYSRHGMIPEAIVMFKEAIRLRPEFAEAYNLLGIDLGRKGDLEEAVAVFEKAIRLRPGYSEAYCNLGIAFSLQGKSREAMAMFQEAVRVNPANGGARNLLKLAQKNLED